jgi:hypothetical protein
MKGYWEDQRSVSGSYFSENPGGWGWPLAPTPPPVATPAPPPPPLTTTIDTLGEETDTLYRGFWKMYSESLASSGDEKAEKGGNGIQGLGSSDLQEM